MAASLLEAPLANIVVDVVSDVVGMVIVLTGLTAIAGLVLLLDQFIR